MSENILILYGSETGNDILMDKGLNTELLEKINVIIIITSTTGNGEMLNNICKFYKYLHKNKICIETINILRGKSLIIFGLGDSNYSEYNQAKKNPKKLLLKIYEMKEIILNSGKDECDDAIDSDEQITKWISSVIKYFNNNDNKDHIKNEAVCNKVAYAKFTGKVISRKIIENITEREKN